MGLSCWPIPAQHPALLSYMAAHCYGALVFLQVRLDDFRAILSIRFY